MFGLHYVNFPPGYENRHSPGQTVEKEKQSIRNCFIFFFLTQQENLQNGKLNIFLSHFSLYRQVEDKISQTSPLRWSSMSQFFFLAPSTIVLQRTPIVSIPSILISGRPANISMVLTMSVIFSKRLQKVSNLPKMQFSLERK